MARHIHALIVDDSSTTRQMVVRALNQTGLAKFVFTEAQDGLDALEKYSPETTEIIFVDMNMPRMDGIAFIHELRSRHETCPPTVMITGESNRERLSDAISEKGVDALLIKPVDRDRLRTGLKTLVESIPARSSLCSVPHGEVVPQAFRDTLSKACKLPLTDSEPDEAVRAGDSVFGIVSIHGAVYWSVVLGFCRDTAVGAASRFAGYAIAVDGPDMGDAIGEIANIMGGKIKGLLGERDLSVKVSMPMVIGASGLQVLVQRNLKGAASHAHFSSPVGKLWTRVAVGIGEGLVL